MSVSEMMNMATILQTLQKIAKDPRPYVVASAPVCLVVGAPLAISGGFMLVGFGFSAVGVLCTLSLAAFFLATALVLLLLGLMPLAVAAWAFKPKGSISLVKRRKILPRTCFILLLSSVRSLLTDSAENKRAREPWVQRIESWPIYRVQEILQHRHHLLRERGPQLQQILRPRHGETQDSCLCQGACSARNRLHGLRQGRSGIVCRQLKDTEDGHLSPSCPMPVYRHHARWAGAGNEMCYRMKYATSGSLLT